MEFHKNNTYGQNNNEDTYIQDHFSFDVVVTMMSRRTEISSSRTRSQLRTVISYTLILRSWALAVAVVSSFTSCPISNSNRFTRISSARLGYNGLFMDNDGSSNSRTDFAGPIHHTAVKTRNITLAIQFYSLLGFEPTAKFKAGPARAAWLEQNAPSSTQGETNSTASISRIELIEVPSWILNEPEGMKRRAFDLFQHQEYLGYNHLALDVTPSIEANKSSLESSLGDHTFLLSAWMETLNEKSLGLFRKTLRVALEAEQFMVGKIVYERAFIYDADGALIELLHKAKELPQYIDPMSGWELYDWFDDKNRMDARNDDKVDSSNN